MYAKKSFKFPVFQLLYGSDDRFSCINIQTHMSNSGWVWEEVT